MGDGLKRAFAAARATRAKKVAPIRYYVVGPRVPVCTHCRGPIEVQPFKYNGHDYHPRTCAKDKCLPGTVTP